MSEPNFIAVWPIYSDLTIEQAKAAALHDLPVVAARSGHHWEPGTPVDFSFPPDGHTPLGIYTGDVIVAHTQVNAHVQYEEDEAA